MARLLIAARRRYYEFRHRQDIRKASGARSDGRAEPHHRNHPGARGSGRDDRDRAVDAVVADHGPRSPRGTRALGGPAGAGCPRVRDQLSSDTWVVLAGVERALAHKAEPPDSLAEADAVLSAAQSQTLVGMLTLAGVAAESMVQDVGWTMMDIGKRIERGLGLTALLNATLTTALAPAAERTVIESTLIATESAVIYRRRTAGQVSVAALAELMLFDATNPRSLVYQLERLRADLGDLPGSSGSSRPERMVAEIGTLLRRSSPADLESVAEGGRRKELADLLTAVHAALRELAEVITATQLALPSGMQPLWGGDERRIVP